MGFFHAGFLLTTAPETCHVWNQCWGDTSGSKVLKLDYRWLQWFQGMAIPSGEAGPGCAGAFADSSAEFIWPCSAETCRIQGHHLVQNKAFPRLLHTMLTFSPERCMCRGGTELGSPYLFPGLSALLSQTRNVFHLQAQFLSCQDALLSPPRILTPYPPLSTTLSPASTCLLSPKEPFLKWSCFH